MNHDRPLKHRARQLRKDQTPAEARLWRELRNRRFAGYKFRRQQPVGPYVADFYCHAAGLVIELDGESHFGRDDYDRQRQGGLESQGLKVLRFFNNDIPANLDELLECIFQECRSRYPVGGTSLAAVGGESDAGGGATSFTPGPSPGGRGEAEGRLSDVVASDATSLTPGLSPGGRGEAISAIPPAEKLQEPR